MLPADLPPPGFRRFESAVGPVLGPAQGTGLSIHGGDGISEPFEFILLLDSRSVDIFKAFPFFGKGRQLRKLAEQRIPYLNIRDEGRKLPSFLFLVLGDIDLGANFRHGLDEPVVLRRERFLLLFGDEPDRSGDTEAKRLEASLRIQTVGGPPGSVEKRLPILHVIGCLEAYKIR